ncbi:hypothetical protein KR222_003475, partial [Zaprionus bogoriensis]
YSTLHTHSLRLLLLCLCFGAFSQRAAAAPLPDLDNNIIEYPALPREVLPIEPLLIYPEPPQMYYEARTLGGNGERDIIFVKLLQGKSKGYRPKQQRLAAKQQRRKELGLNDIFFVKARANGQFSHERLKVYRLPEFYAISVYRNDDE